MRDASAPTKPAPCTRHVRTPIPARNATRALVCAVVPLVTALLLTASSAAAQPDHVLLARSCVSERGFRTATDDCAGIMLVAQARMARRAELFRSAIRALAPRLHHPDCRVSRRWLCELDETADRPAHLGRARWAGARRDAWLATLAEARALLDGTRTIVCSAPPTAWGSTDDLRRRRLAGYRWRPAVCEGATFANHFGTLLQPHPTERE